VLKNTAGQKVVVFAWDTANQTPKTGDAANITAKLSKDGGTYTALSDTNPTELERGRYAFDLTQEETNCDRWHLIPYSATSDVIVTCEECCFDTTIGATSEQSILSAVSSSSVNVNGAVTDSGSLTLYNGRNYGGAAHTAIGFTVAKNYASATSVELVLFTLGDPSDELQTLSATVASSTSVTVAGTISVSGDYTGEVAVLGVGYTLHASWSGAMETIATGKAYIYKQPS
jgi:hypothetical protein